MCRKLAILLLVLYGCAGPAFVATDPVDQLDAGPVGAPDSAPQVRIGVAEPDAATGIDGTLVGTMTDSTSTPDAATTPRAEADASPSEAALDAGLELASKDVAPPAVTKSLFIIFDRTIFTVTDAVESPDAGVTGAIFAEGLKRFVGEEANTLHLALQFEPIPVVRNGALAPSADVADYNPPALPFGSSVQLWESVLTSLAGITNGWRGTELAPATRAAITYLTESKTDHAAVVFLTRFADDLSVVTALRNARIPYFVLSAKGTEQSSVNDLAFNSASRTRAPFWCASVDDVRSALADIASY